jgi:predicted phage terminase large subunit-like protein
MSDRLNSLQTGCIIVIMQRSHEDDVAGAILSLGLPYCHLMIPMEYDWERQTDNDGEPVSTEIGWSDPRYVPLQPEACDGVLAWPERFPPHEVSDIRTIKGPYAYAGQYQQAPSPRGGGIFQRLWWQLWEPADGKFPVFEYVLASLDSAFTEREENDPSALTVWGIFLTKEGDRRIMLVHAWRKHLPFSGPRIERLPKESDAAYKRRTQDQWGLMEWVNDTCGRFRVDKLLIEAKANGISASQELRNRFGTQNWAVQLCPVKGDKVARAVAVQPTLSQGLVYAPARDWAEMMIDEASVFPKGRHDDLTDSMTQAFKHLRETGLAQTDDEVRYADNERATHRSKLEPIYPV